MCVIIRAYDSPILGLDSLGGMISTASLLLCENCALQK